MVLLFLYSVLYVNIRTSVVHAHHVISSQGEEFVSLNYFHAQHIDEEMNKAHITDF